MTETEGKLATDITPDDYDALLEAEVRDFGNAADQARSHLRAMTDAASAANQWADNSLADYSLHEIDSMGRYAVIRKQGWRPLLDVIHTPSANIDFSPAAYPNFDGIIGQHFNTPYLLDPLHDKFASYEHLRDNIAAVRNFLMESYYVNTPAGMTPEKAQQSLEEIAAFVGDGLYNNFLFLGLIPNHDPKKPFIDLSEASETGGAGAQYIYERILEMHRRSSWLRPFSAVIALFGGKTAPDWMLPPANETEFTLFEEDIAPTKPHDASTTGEIQAEMARIDALEAARQEAKDRHQINIVATDLDAIGNYLLSSAANMQNVAHVSEPVRRDAIDIAKKILRDLKLSLGDINVLDGLNLPPKQDVSALGGIKGVAMIYERLLAWGRGIDPKIMQEPSVLAATQAIGQMGHLAKREALVMAELAKNTGLADRLRSQIDRIPAAFANVTDSNKSFGAMLDKVERGIDTIMNRIQVISGPGMKVGFSVGNELGSTANYAPTAGLAQQMASAQLNRDAELARQQAALVQTAQDNAARATTARSQSQSPPRERSGSQPEQPRAQTRSVGAIRPLVQAKTSSKVSASATVKPNALPATLSPTQMQSMRANASRLAHEHEEHERLHQKQQIDLQNAQKSAQKASVKAAIGKIDPALLSGFQKATSAKGLTGVPVNPGSKGAHSVGQKIMASSKVASVQNKHVPAQPKAIEGEPPPYVPTSPTRGGRGF